MRNVANSLRVFRLLAALLIAGAAATTAQAQSTLRWKFQPGETLNYQMGQKSTSKLSRMGQSVETSITQTIDTAWTAKSVENGIADVTIKIQRLRSNLTAPNATLNFDSQNEKPPEGPIGEALGPILQAMAGSEISLKIDDRGEITDVKVSQKLVDAVKARAGAGAGAGGAFSEDRFKDQFKQSIFVFPKEPIQAGSTWTSKVELPPQPFTLVLDNTYTFKGPSPKDANLDLIELKIVLSAKPMPNAQVEVDIKSQEGKGIFLFDRAKGHLTESTIIRKHEMNLSSGGAVLTQAVDSTETMKLIPPGGQ